MNKIWITKNLDLIDKQDEKGIEKKILNQLNFSLHKSSISSIVAEENAEMSKFLKTISCIEDNFCREINPEIKIGYLSERRIVFPWLNVFENITIGQKNPDKNKVNEIVEFIGLSGYENHFPNKKSFGFNFRVGLGRMLLYDFDLILIDNSLQFIQQKSKQSIYELLIKISSNLEKTILLYTRNIQEAVFLSSNIFIYNSFEKSFNEQIIEFAEPRNEMLFFEKSFQEKISQIYSIYRKLLIVR